MRERLSHFSVLPLNSLRPIKSKAAAVNYLSCANTMIGKKSNQSLSLSHPPPPAEAQGRRRDLLHSEVRKCREGINGVVRVGDAGEELWFSAHCKSVHISPSTGPEPPTLPIFDPEQAWLLYISDTTARSQPSHVDLQLSRR